MTVYYWQIALLLISAVLSKLTKNPKKTICILSFFILAVVIGFRDPIGGFNGDNLRYYLRYYKLGESPISACYEMRNGQNILFFFLQWLFAHLGIHYIIFNISVAIFSVGITSWFIYKYSDNPFISFFIYLGLLVYPLSFYLVKQAIAISITLLAFDSCRKNHRVRGLILCLIAALIHDAAIVFLVVIFADKIIRFSKINLMLIAILGIIVFLYRIQIGQFIMLLFKEEYIGAYTSRVQLGGLALILLAFFAFYILSIDTKSLRNVYTDESKLSATYEHSLFSIGAIALFIQILASYAYAYTRLNLFYLQFYMIIFPHSVVQRRWKRSFRNFYPIFCLTVYSAVIVLMCVLYFGTQRPYDTEYRFFWQSNIW